MIQTRSGASLTPIRDSTMIIIKGTRDQSHEDFGPRRGTQCVSNSFVFLQACFIRDPRNITASDIDIILIEGTKIDATIPVSDTSPFRLVTDIPTTLHTSYGVTRHVFNPPQSGVAASVSIDGQPYAGLLDTLNGMQMAVRESKTFLFYIIIIDSMARGICLTNDGTFYMFDPHVSSLSATAALYVTVDVNSLYGLLYRDDLYFEITEIFFVNASDTPLVPGTSKPPTPSLSLPVKSLRGKRRSVPVSEDVEQKREKPIFDVRPTNLLPDIQSLTSLDAELYETPNLFNKTHMAILCDGKGFRSTFPEFRLEQLLAACVDHGMCLKAAASASTLEFLREIQLASEVLGYADMAHTAAICIDSSVNILELHKQISNMRGVPASVVASKLNAIFHARLPATKQALDAWSDEHRRNVMNKQKTNLDAIPELIALPSFEERAFTDKIKDTLTRSLQDNEVSNIESQNIQAIVVDAIDRGTSDEVLKRIAHEAPQLLPQIHEFIGGYYNRQINDISGDFWDLINAKKNDIMAGNMPNKELGDMRQRIGVIRNFISRHKNQVTPDLIQGDRELEKLNSYTEYMDTGEIHGDIPSILKTMRAHHANQTAMVLYNKVRDLVAVYKSNPDQDIDLIQQHRAQVLALPWTDQTDALVEDMDVIISDNSKNMIRQKLQGVTLASPLDTETLNDPMFNSMLLESKDFLTMYEDKIRSLFSSIMQEYTLQKPLTQKTFFGVRNMLERHPNEGSKSSFMKQFLLLESLNPEIPMNTLAKTGKIIWKFDNNQNTWNAMRSYEYAQTLMDTVSSLHIEHSIKNSEDEWAKQAKNYVVLSAADAENFLNQAPTTSVRSKYENTIKKKIKQHEEKEDKKRQTELETTKRENTKKLEKLTHDLTTSIKNGQFDKVNASNMLLLKQTATDLDTSADLNVNLNKEITGSISNMKAHVEDVIKSLIYQNLKKVFTPQESFTDIKQFVDAMNILRSHGMLSAQDQETIQNIMKELSFIKDLQKNWLASDPVYLNSKYRDDFQTMNRLNKVISDIPDQKDRVHDHETKLEKALKTPEILNPDEFIMKFSDVTLKETDKIDRDKLYEPFRTIVNENLEKKQAEIKDGISNINKKSKEEIALHNQYLSDREGLVSNMIKQRYLTIASIADFDVAKMSNSPLDYFVDDLPKKLKKRSYTDTVKLLQWTIDTLEAIEPFLSKDKLDSYEHLHNGLNIELSDNKQKQLMEAQLETEEDPLKFQTILEQLDPDKLEGGRKTHKEYEQRLKDLKARENRQELQMSYEQDYENLFNEIQNLTFGLNFETVLDKFQKLKEQYKSLDTTWTDATITYIKHMINFKKKIVKKQPLIMTENSFAVPEILSATVLATDRPIRALHRCSNNGPETWYEVTTPFSDRELVNKDGIPIKLKICFYNFVTKFFEFYKNELLTSESQNVTRTYKAHIVAYELGRAMDTHWNDIESFTLKTYINNSRELLNNTDVIVLYSLKLFAYCICLPWYLLETTGEHTTKIPIAKFLTLMACFYPNVVMGVVTTPVSAGVKSILSSFDRADFYRRCNITTPPDSGTFPNGIMSYCIHEKDWDVIDASRFLWDDALMSQLGGVFSKLTMYILALLVLPLDVLNNIWEELKVPGIANISFSEYVSNIYTAIFQSNSYTESIPVDVMKERLGEIYRVVSTEQDTAVTKIAQEFQNTHDALDFAIASYLFGIDLVIAMKLTDIHNDTVLLVNLLSNTDRSDDYTNIVINRQLDFRQMLQSIWDTNPIEQSWFESQAEKLRTHLLRTKDMPPILIQVTDDRSFIKSMIQGSSRSKKLFDIDNPFTEQIHTEEDATVLEFAFCPTDLKFLLYPFPLTPASYDSPVPDTVFPHDDIDQPSDRRKTLRTMLNRIHAHSETSRLTAHEHRSLHGHKNAISDSDYIRITKLHTPHTKVAVNYRPIPYEEKVSIDFSALDNPFEESPQYWLTDKIEQALDKLTAIQAKISLFKDAFIDAINRLQRLYIN